MRILHTADWHIGQTFHEHDRSYEHEQFLNWLANTIAEQQIDVLLMSGDVFDGSNPSAASINLLYQFLATVTRANPQLQVIITAGNHDSAARLEAPNPFFEFYNIRIVGIMPRLGDGSFDHEKLLVPLKNKDGLIEAWCMAIPYLRPGDYPLVNGSNSVYADGVTELYNQSYAYAQSQQQEGQAIIAMGHLHTLGAEKSGNDKNERLIMGGIEYIPSAAFDDRIAYTALGHIHKAQMIGGRENIRYSGSPLPMSFTELNYKHQVVVFELENEKAINIKQLEVPVTVALLRVPTVPKKLSEVLDELHLLPEAGHQIELSPYLEVRVLLEGPEPSLRHQIETALTNKHVRFTKIEVSYPVGNQPEEAVLNFDQLQELAPIDVFNKIYKSRFDCVPPDELIQLFNQVSFEINCKEN